MTQRRSWRWRMGWGGLAAVLGSMSVCVEAPLAASGWLPPADISATGAATSRVQVAVDGQGNAVAIWRRGVDGGEVTVQSAVRPAGGPWQAPVDVSRPGSDGSAPLGRGVPGPQLALDAEGKAVAVWQRYNGTSLVIQAAERPAGGSWGAPVDVSVPGTVGEDSGSPRIAIDRQGNAVAIWHRNDPIRRLNRVQSAARPAGGTWQPPVAVSAPNVNATGARIAVDAQGGAIAVWQRPVVEQTFAQSAMRQPDGTWQPPEDIPDSRAMVDLDIAIDPAGNAFAVWSGFDFEPTVRAAVRPVAGSWQSPVGLARTGHAPSIALDAAGNATAVWYDADRGVITATRPAGGTWQPGVSIGSAQPGFSELTNVVVDERGDAIAAWSSVSPPSGAVVRRRIAGEWQETTRLAADGRSPGTPELAVDPNGNAVAAWSDSTAGVVSAAGFDATAPELRAVAVPASGAAGRPVSFSALPFDVWSVPSPALWDFGDGTTASGSVVTHTYADVGLRTVGVSATDNFGNPAAATGAILIGPSVLGLRVSPYAFRTSRPGRVSLRLPAASSVRFIVGRARSGRRVGGRCVAPKPGNRRRAACERYVRAGSFTRFRPSGTHGFKLPIRFGGRRLARGRYRLSATPTAGGVRGAPSRSGFHVTG